VVESLPLQYPFDVLDQQLFRLTSLKINQVNDDEEEEEEEQGGGEEEEEGGGGEGGGGEEKERNGKRGNE
jgi:hypothetical protein